MRMPISVGRCAQCDEWMAHEVLPAPTHADEILQTPQRNRDQIRACKTPEPTQSQQQAVQIGATNPVVWRLAIMYGVPALSKG